jgi:outer membrane protein OmpA-like peptidoglycan-associated protein
MRGVMLAIAIGLAGSGAGAQDQLSAESAGTMMIFFDWGKPDPRGDDAATLDRAASAWRANPEARLQLSGHTDRSGSAPYNRLAARRRAEAVRNQLVERGVPMAAISIVPYGEARPLVPTEDGVREVQNRRVEIHIQE